MGHDEGTDGGRGGRGGGEGGGEGGVGGSGGGEGGGEGGGGEGAMSARAVTLLVTPETVVPSALERVVVVMAAAAVVAAATLDMMAVAVTRTLPLVVADSCTRLLATPRSVAYPSRSVSRCDSKVTMSMARMKVASTTDAYAPPGVRGGGEGGGGDGGGEGGGDGGGGEGGGAGGAGGGEGGGGEGGGEGGGGEGGGGTGEFGSEGGRGGGASQVEMEPDTPVRLIAKVQTEPPTLIKLSPWP